MPTGILQRHNLLESQGFGRTAGLNVKNLAFGLIGSALLCAGTASGAVAQTTPAMPGIGGLIPKGISVTVGAMAIYEPKYEGSKKYEFSFLPVFKFDTGGGGLSDRLDVRGLDDISFAIAKTDAFQMGVLTGYRAERKESDSPRLRGLGDVDGGIVIGGFARYNMGPAYLRASYHRQVIEDDTGGLLKFVLGDRDYMQTYFGVNTAQSARSGILPVYNPTGGAKSFNMGVGTDFEVIPTWTLTASAEYIHYLGPASRSPIIEESDQIKARVGVSKKFSFGFGN
jgi:MipA family protein